VWPSWFPSSRFRTPGQKPSQAQLGDLGNTYHLTFFKENQGNRLTRRPATVDNF
jgi:hypothetical protein